MIPSSPTSFSVRVRERSREFQTVVVFLRRVMFSLFVSREVLGP